MCIYALILTYSGKKKLKLVESLFNRKMERNKIPEEMHTWGHIRTIFKKGDRMHCLNYRPMSIFAVLKEDF